MVDDSRDRGAPAAVDQAAPKDVSAEAGAVRHDSKVDSSSDAPVVLTQEPSYNNPAPASDGTTPTTAHHNAAALHNLDFSAIAQAPSLTIRNANAAFPASPQLQIQTNVEAPSPAPASPRDTPVIYETPLSTEPPQTQYLTSPTYFNMAHSLRSNQSASSIASSLSPGSALPSPYLAAMSDLTPLPSPMVGMDLSSSMGRDKNGKPSGQSRSRAGSLEDSMPSGRPSSELPSPSSPQRRRKNYSSLLQGAVEANAAAAEGNAKTVKSHTRTRSVSDFVPEPLQNVRHRHVTFGSGDAASLEAHDYSMQRERYLAAHRGLTAPSSIDPNLQVPTPPPSTSSMAESDDADADEQSQSQQQQEQQQEQPYLEDGSATEYLEIHCGMKNKRRKFRQLRELGRGTFSKVMLATRERIPAHPTPEIEEYLDPHQLVAVKIIEHGPAGGADEERIETSLRREVEMLKSISHPSLVHLKSCEYQSTRTLLVLTYCRGGDLFELASQKREVLTPPLVQRMFAELVSAVRYLHANWIVHRDIKLENVLANYTNTDLLSITTPQTHPTPIVTLTDLGLSRRIPQPPESPLLQTRCGSEDYAAPEILLGQSYDGRQTDAWALGVLLYALLEGRLPFDAPPGKPDRSRNTHRIARCDWIWCRFGDEDGEWDGNANAASGAKAAEFEGARAVVEALLKKVRMGRRSLEDVERMEWVRAGIQVPGGLKLREEDEDDAALL